MVLSYHMADLKDIVTKSENMDTTPLLVTCNDPTIKSILLNRISPFLKETKQEKIWFMLKSNNNVQASAVFLEKNPACFSFCFHKEGVSVNGESENATTPLHVSTGKHFDAYEWRFNENSEKHDVTMSTVTEYTIERPYGKLIVSSGLLKEKYDIDIIPMNLKYEKNFYEKYEKLEDKELQKKIQDQDVVYCGTYTWPHEYENTGDSAFVYVTFRRMNDSTDPSHGRDILYLSSFAFVTTYV